MPVRWGALCEGIPAFGSWSSLEKCLHINSLEMMPLFLALKTFLPAQQGYHNMTMMAFINRSVGCLQGNPSPQTVQIFLGDLREGRDKPLHLRQLLLLNIFSQRNRMRWPRIGPKLACMLSPRSLCSLRSSGNVQFYRWLHSGETNRGSPS